MFSIIFTVFGQVFISIIKLVPTFIELKNLPIDIMAVALGVPAIVISLGLMIINKIKKELGIS